MGRSRVLSRRAVFPILQQRGLVDVRRRGGHIVIAGPHRRRQRRGSHSERPRARDRLLSITPQSGYIERSSKKNLQRVSIAWMRRIIRATQLVESLGENVAGLIHGFESRWGHQFDFVRVLRPAF